MVRTQDADCCWRMASAYRSPWCCLTVRPRLPQAVPIRTILAAPMWRYAKPSNIRTSQRMTGRHVVAARFTSRVQVDAVPARFLAGS